MDTLENLNELNPLSQITWASKSHVGMRRSENQDAHGEIETDQYKFFIVADGMGGVHGGAVASSLAIAAIKEALQGFEKPTETDLVNAVKEANKAVFNRGLEDRTLSGMGTTLVGLLFYSNRMFCVNVGDSRAYLIRDGLTMQLTQDHTVVSELLRSGAIDESQVSNHPISHMLTRSIGPTADIVADCFVIPNAPLASDRFLLCSDGLYNHLDSSEIAKIVENNSPELACERLIELTNERGGSDNITAIIIDVDQEYSSPTLDFDETATSIFEPTFEKQDPDSTVANGISKKHSISDNGESYEKLAPEAGMASRVARIAKDSTAKTMTAVPALSAVPNRLTPLGISIITIVVVMLWWAIDRGGHSTKLPQSDLVTQSVKESGTSNSNIPLAQQAKQAGKNSQLEQGSSDYTQQSETGAQENVGESQDLLDRPFGSERLENARVRMKLLQVRIGDIEEKLAAFDRPLSGAVAQNLSQLTRKQENLKNKISEIDGQLAEAARGLAVLYGQQQRMRSMELLKLAAEVAGSSGAVEAQKKVFEAVSWRYLKEREKIERDPRNQEIRQRVDELALERRQELDKLGQVVRQSIIAETLKLDRQSADLSKEKQELDSELQTGQAELDFLYTLMSQDPGRRNSLRASLEEDLRRNQAEFNTLQNMVLSLLGEDAPAH